MNTRSWRVFAWLCGFVVMGCCSITLSAQMTEVKEKPPMYSYVASWQIPRAHWGEMEKSYAGDKEIMEKALADGTIVGYGNDSAAVHQLDGATHDDWWSATSMAGVLKVLEQLGAAGGTESPVLETATKHWDTIFVSRFYNWRSGSYKGAYTHVSTYRLRPDAPDNAIEMLSKHMVVPLLEKMLADGTILEYEIDTLAIHTEAPGNFWIVYVAPSPEGFDKVTAAITDSLKEHALSGPAFGSMTDSSGHRDDVVRGDGKYK